MDHSKSTAGHLRWCTARRSRGRAFTFLVDADPHLDENSDPATYRNALKTMGACKADFLCFKAWKYKKAMISSKPSKA